MDSVSVVTADPNLTILDESAGWLVGASRNDTSQFGEDGLIEAVFAKIGTTNEWCFEVGAADGLFFSNTKRLRDAGWRAVLIEADELNFQKCLAFADQKVQVFKERIGHSSLDPILQGCGSPTRPDLGVIDIDGQDYWAWSGMECIKPRVMLVEFAYYQPADYIPNLNEPKNGEQAGLQAIIDLGISKGYIAVAHTYCNVLFVDRNAWP